MTKQVIKPALAAGIGALALIANSSSAAAAACTSGQPSQCDSAAAEVLLRKSCTDNSTTLNNCFTSVSALNTWIWSTRNPTPSSPLHVRIGTGSFAGMLTCNKQSPTPANPDRGYVTYTGAGVGNSILETVSTRECKSLVFQNLTVKSAAGPTAVMEAGGQSVWKNVEIISPGYPWADALTFEGCIPGEHYIFSSRLVSTDADPTYHISGAIYNECGELWVHGTELTSTAETDGRLQTVRADGGEVYIFGGVIRALPGTSTYDEISAPQLLPLAIYASHGAKVNVHGAGIEVNSTAGINVSAIVAFDNSVVDANGTSYNLSSEDPITHTKGTITRIYKIGTPTVDAPYLWQGKPSTSVPGDSVPPTIDSLTGADTAMVITGGNPRLLIYKAGCSSKWYDPHTTSCY